MHSHSNSHAGLIIDRRTVSLERPSSRLPVARSSFGRCLAMLVVAFSGLGAVPAGALTLCANSVSSLQTALSAARIANEPVTIRIATGTYQLPGLSLAARTPFTMLGGYDNGCTSRPATVRPLDTVLDFAGSGVYIGQLYWSPVSMVAIDGLSLQNTYGLTLEAGDWGVEGNVSLSRTRITGLPTSSKEVSFAALGHGSVKLDNVLMDALPGGMPSGDCSVEAELREGGVIELVNTTIALPANETLCLTNPNHQDSAASLYNTIVWSAIQTSGIDSTVDVVNSFNSTYFGLNRHGGTGATSGELHDDPMWRDPAASDYRLSANSTSVNSGTPIPPGGLASYDIDGQPRWQGQLPDRGAYESDYQNAETYVVTKTDDSGTGSLRDAMTRANEDPNLGIVTFAIPGSCPRVITLATPLPKLTTPMLIDGTTQPGWVANTDDDAFLATLCIVVKPASGSLSYAFNAPAGADGASLKLRGIAMGGFQQPVFLAGGSDHVIAGDRFGGFMGAGVDLPGASLNSINVVGSLGNGSFLIGGAGPADRNLISGSAYSGINIQHDVDGSHAHCQVVGNLIGTSPSGNVAAPNFVGITVAGTHCLIDANRIVGNTTDGIVLSGAIDSLIQRNIIGLTVEGNGLPNSGAGIRFAASAAANVIGAPLSTYAWGFRNTIRFMANAGIAIPAGVENTIRSNEIRDNGIGADGLDIDLGDDGPTANDGGDADASLANFGQNFPLVSHVAIPQGTAGNATAVSATLTAQLDSAPGHYRIDAYFSNHCGGNGRGHADAYLGGTTAENLEVFEYVVTLPNVLPTGFVSLTATDHDGNTSEMGTCFPVVGGDTVFRNGFDG